MDYPRKDLKVYTLYVAGVFGRNRRAKNGMFKIAEVPAAEPLPSGEIARLAHARLVAEKVKPDARYNVIESDEWVEDRGGNLEVRGFQLGRARQVMAPATWTYGTPGF